MRRVAMRVGAAFALGLGLVASLPAAADDTKPTTEPSSSSSQAKPLSFAGYVYITDVVGEVVKADDKTVTGCGSPELQTVQKKSRETTITAART